MNLVQQLLTDSGLQSFSYCKIFVSSKTSMALKKSEMTHGVEILYEPGSAARLRARRTRRAAVRPETFLLPVAFLVSR
jgi:hypothetical protein